MYKYNIISHELLLFHFPGSMSTAPRWTSATRSGATTSSSTRAPTSPTSSARGDTTRWGRNVHELGARDSNRQTQTVGLTCTRGCGCCRREGAFIVPYPTARIRFEQIKFTTILEVGSALFRLKRFVQLRHFCNFQLTCRPVRTRFGKIWSTLAGVGSN